MLKASMVGAASSHILGSLTGNIDVTVYFGEPYKGVHEFLFEKEPPGNDLGSN